MGGRRVPPAQCQMKVTAKGYLGPEEGRSTQLLIQQHLTHIATPRDQSYVKVVLYDILWEIIESLKGA